MVGKVIVVTSGKGGVGKTTAVANIGTALASMEKKIALVDADIGLRNLDVVLGLENRIVYDIVDVVEGRAKLRQALIKDKRFPTLSLLPAAQTREKDAVSPEDMLRLCEELKTQFDFIIIDSPAGIEQGFKNAVVPADIALIVTTPEVSAVRDADRVIGLLESMEKSDGRLIINRVRTKLVDRGDMLSIEDVLEILSIELIGVIPEDENIIISTNKGEPVVNNGNAPAGKSFLDIARRILGEDVPINLHREKEGIFNRLLRFIGRREE
ncbi:MAG: septum site-determining protein MinD [bacterium]